VRLTDLDPQFVKRELRVCDGHDCSVVAPHPMEHEYYCPSDLPSADGISFICPKCFAVNGGPIGVHSVLCWRPRVAAGISPGPGRWEFLGTGYEDLTLVAGSSSVKLTGGCGAHFHVTSGAITEDEPFR
jgi:hypothetical protein